MAGIYIHIPFCKSRCIYCGFYSTTSLSLIDDYVRTVCLELSMRKDYLRGDPVSTIYFGGGTPSQLRLAHLETILNSIYNIYNVEAKEITVECNPDDLDNGTDGSALLSALQGMGVNRLSLGIQTFDDVRLRFLRRRHTSSQAVAAVGRAQAAGFDNISVDLMFGFPGQSLQAWQQDLHRAVSLDVQHLSAYSLMYEEGTQLERMLTQGEITEISDDLSLTMYEHLLDTMALNGFEHYEISNFARPGRQSLHNSGYWQGVPYLGIGAGAHSFDGNTRQYNADDIGKYLKAEASLIFPVTLEQLSPNERYNEFVFTSLRTRQGLDLQLLADRFGPTLLKYCLRNAEAHLRSGRLNKTGNRLHLTRHGLFISDSIMSDLMMVDND